MFLYFTGNEKFIPHSSSILCSILVGAKAVGGVGVEKQMEKTVRKRTLLILVLKQIQETCEGPAHQEERFPPTLLHTGQLSECRA